ncbi:CoA transferase [Aquabacter sp. CN5-332]|uniref:CaiB/BaiF CoA transferase family protein n=1 Tax=Aquabacter sp. CN5-332 TaxID=3156608 RepID=UPI0032B34869
MPDRPLPLSGVRALEISTAWAGPMAGRILADLGAEVIKVEHLDAIDNWRGAVTGDDRNRYPDFQPGLRPYDRSAWFNTQNLGKRSLGLDLKAPSTRPAIEALVRQCDVVVSNFAAGALGRLGLAYENLVALRPDVILLEMVVTGEGGPMSDMRGVGPTMEALASMTGLTGYGDGIPQRTGPAYVDPIGALNGAMAVMLALYHRRRTGEGQRIELAQRESLMHWYGERFLAQAEDGRETAPTGNRTPRAAPHDAYRTLGEDQWVAIAAFEEAQWTALCAAMERPALAQDPRFQDLETRQKNHAALRLEIEAWTGTRDKRAVAELLQREGVPAAPVSSGRDVHDDPQLAATGFISILDHPAAGRHRYQGLPFRFDNRPPTPAPLLGQDTRHVLAEVARLSDREIAALLESGAALEPGEPT